VLEFLKSEFSSFSRYFVKDASILNHCVILQNIQLYQTRPATLNGV